MTPVELLLQLQSQDIRLWTEGGELKLSQPLESVPAELRTAIEDQRGALVAFLDEAARAHGGGDDSSDATAGDAGGIVPVARGTDADLPLSFAQQRLWFLLQIEQDSSAYNLLYVVRLRGALDADTLGQSLQEIVRRHEVLRTTFGSVEGQPAQEIHGEDAVTVPLERADVAAEPDPDAAAKTLVMDELARSFDATQGPLLRATLVRVGPDEHRLLLTMLHLVSDGWSYGVLFAELTELYGARLENRAPNLPTLKVHYADYAHWQRAHYGRESARLLGYWQEQLKGLTTLELPTDHPRPSVQTFRGTRRYFALPDALQEKVRALGKREKCTFFMTMLTAFDVLLAHFAGQDDIVVGTPIANRDREELEPLIGLFLNTLVLRTDLAGNPTFREAMARVRETALAGYQHQDMPFEQLVVELNPERDLSRNPVFQVLFNVLYEAPPPELGALQAEFIEPGTVTSQFDLSLVLASTGGYFEYNLDLFDDATIEALFHRFERLLEAAVANPDARIHDLPLLSDAEREDLLVARNKTAMEYPREQCFWELFAARAVAQPDAPAARFGDETLTYGELNARANRLARHLRAQGAGPHVLIGLSVERSMDMLVALLAIQKSGAAYVPLDPTYPAERIEFILQDADARLLVTTSDLEGDLPAVIPPLVLLDGDAETIAAQDPSDLERHGDASSLAYVIFTSGSTGVPKGVQIEHRALVNFLTTMAAKPGFTADDVLVAVTTISFDIAGLELYLPLLQGGQVVIASDDDASDGRGLRDLLNAAGATVMQATPATWRLLIEADWKSEQLTALCGGEALPRELAEQLLPRCKALWNMYGPTETTIWSLVDPVASGEGPVPLGAPIGNTQVYLLDRKYRKPVPVGVPGQLYLGGDGLARGYWNRPELTAEKFVAHPFDDAPGARVYDTGDLARYRHDGSLEFLGRVDHQVKIRGFRIELGEIEHVLTQHDAVAACAVVPQQRSGSDQLVAHVVFADGTSATVSELRKHLRGSLPDYMVPPTYVTLDELPLTPNGKIDRKALSQATGQQATEAYVPPASEMEKFIASVWEDVLGIDRVGRFDNFFHVGGHSLLAMKVAYQVEQKIGRRVLPMEMLIQDLRMFAEMCEKRGGAAKSAAGVDAGDEAPAKKGVFGRLKSKLGRRAK